MQTVLGVAGLASLIEDRLDGLQGEVWEQWVDINFRLAADPSIQGACEPLLAIARKKIDTIISVPGRYSDAARTPAQALQLPIRSCFHMPVPGFAPGGLALRRR